jgi:hypothetical protein
MNHAFVEQLGFDTAKFIMLHNARHFVTGEDKDNNSELKYIAGRPAQIK